MHEEQEKVMAKLSQQLARGDEWWLSVAEVLFNAHYPDVGTEGNRAVFSAQPERVRSHWVGVARAVVGFVGNETAGAAPDAGSPADWQEKIAAAYRMVDALSQPRGTQGAREWVLSIPIRREHDPDCVINDGLLAAEKRITELEAELAALRAVPPGVPSVEDLARVGREGQRRADPSWVKYDKCCKSIQVGLEFFAAAVRDAILAALPVPEAQSDEWKAAVDDALVCCDMTADSFASPREAVQALLTWHTKADGWLASDDLRQRQIECYEQWLIAYAHASWSPERAHEWAVKAALSLPSRLAELTAALDEKGGAR